MRRRLGAQPSMITNFKLKGWMDSEPPPIRTLEEFSVTTCPLQTLRHGSTPRLTPAISTKPAAWSRTLVFLQRILLSLRRLCTSEQVQSVFPGVHPWRGVEAGV